MDASLLVLKQTENQTAYRWPVTEMEPAESAIALPAKAWW
jgi:hypothetical protein